jgi:hypothetical protein
MSNKNQNQRIEIAKEKKAPGSKRLEEFFLKKLYPRERRDQLLEAETKCVEEKIRDELSTIEHDRRLRGTLPPFARSTEGHSIGNLGC